MPSVSWIVLLALLVVVFAVWVLKARPRGAAAAAALPTEWALTPRPVFNTDERRVYRLLREALPHHIVLSKLPLVRFCQPTDANEVRYWYDLLGANHVAFAVCSANGRVLAAIDLDGDRINSRRVMQIKQSVLATCRVRYLRCPADRLPTIAELQLLVPQNANTARGPQPAPGPAPTLHEARDSLASTVATRRAERTALWQDSTFFQDSFFAPDSRLDGLNLSDFAPTHPSPPNGHTPSLHPHPSDGGETEGSGSDDLGGIVVDSSQQPSPTRH
jgi:hypothetical protein